MSWPKPPPNTRIFTVGAPVIAYKPVDERQLASDTAALDRMLDFYQDHPEHAAVLIRRVPLLGQRIHIFQPDGMLVTRHTGPEGNRLRARLDRLTEECTQRGLVLSVAAWTPHFDRSVLTQRERRPAERPRKRRK